jgi:hypothetical protein
VKRLLPVLLVFLFSTPALAIPVTYTDIAGGQVIINASQGGSLVGSVASDITIGSATIDTATNQLLSLSISVDGPILLTFASPVNGLDSIEISDALLETTTAAALAVFAVPGFDYFGQFAGVASEIGAGALVLNLDGGGSVPSSLDPPVATTTSGTVRIVGNEVDLSVNGVSIGAFSAIPPSAGDDVVVTANFSFKGTEAIPEPNAAALFSLGALVVVSSFRRRSAARVR